MAAIYDKFKRALARDQLGGDITTLNIKCALVDTGTYTFAQTHEFLNDLTGVVATSGNVPNVTVSEAGVIDCDNFTITSVSGDTVEAVVFYVDTGVATTSQLIVFIDGLTLTPDGGNVDVTVNSIVNL